MTYADVETLFAYKHLPPHLMRISQPYYDKATDIFVSYPEALVRDLVILKLLEAKDAHVRLVAKHGERK